MIKKKDESKPQKEKQPKIDPKISELEKQVAVLQIEKADLADSLKQIAADFANVRRRHDEEKTRGSSLATNGLVMEIFPILDNFRRASEHAPAIEITDDNIPDLGEDDFRKISAYFEGIRQIEKQLESVLQNVGLIRIETINQSFDPRTMEAIAYESHPELPENTVIDELEGGYKLNDKVIRPAKVRVSSGQ